MTRGERRRIHHFAPAIRQRALIDPPEPGVQACAAFEARHPHHCKLSEPPPPNSIVTSKKLSPERDDSGGASPTPPADFERSLSELEAIVEQLEQGDLSLDDSLRHFERGVQLTRVCQNALKQAEQKVKILLRRTRQTGGDN